MPQLRRFSRVDKSHKGVDECQPPVNDLAMLHVFGIERGASGLQDSGDNQAVVWPKP